MFLTKNKLKKIKKVEDDDMLHYLKYSHLEPIKEDNTLKFDASPEARVLPVKATQTINTAEQGVDTGNDFDEVTPPYVSLMYSEDFDRNDKMVQVWTKMIKQNLSSPPSSSSSSSSSSNNSEGFLFKTARRGFRLAEFALNTSIMGANLTMAVADTISDMITAPHQSLEEEEQQNNQEVISVHSSPPQTVNSSSSPDVIEISSSSSSRNAPSSIPAPTSPQPSTPASSAKTTPRRK